MTKVKRKQMTNKYTNEGLREFGAEHGFTKHVIVSVNNYLGTIGLRGYGKPVLYSDLA